MKVTHKSTDRLVLQVTRRLLGLVLIVAAPLTVWLGWMILEEGGTEWFGWAFIVSGVILMCGGIMAQFIRLSLVLDRPQDLVRFSAQGPFKRQNRMMALSAVATIEQRAVWIGRAEVHELTFVPHPDSDSDGLRIREFWTSDGADAARAEVEAWLDNPPRSPTAPN